MDDVGSNARQSNRTAHGSVAVMCRDELKGNACWASAFAAERKDHRYYELVEDTIQQDFVFRYFAIKDAGGTVRSVQPFFVIDQDMLVGMSPRIGGVDTIHPPPVAAIHEDAHADGRMRCGRRPSGWSRLRTGRLCSDSGAKARAAGPQAEDRIDCPQGVPGQVSFRPAVLRGRGIYPRAEPADDLPRHQLRRLRRLHEARAQQRDAKEAAQEIRRRGAGRSDRDERGGRRHPSHRRYLPALPSGLRPVEASFRETDQGVFLQPGPS